MARRRSKKVRKLLTAGSLQGDEIVYVVEPAGGDRKTTVQEVADLFTGEGPPGEAATIEVGIVTTVDPGDPATVVNVGNETAAILDFGIPQGETGGTGSQGIQGIQGETGAAGDDAYVYIAYASDAVGTGFTLTFNAALDYIAIKSTTVAIATPVVGDFAGLWKNYKGETGDTGLTGDTGSTGAAGADGAVWYSGATDPDNGNGVNGDFYLQTGTGSTGVLGDVWVKAGGSWSIDTNIRGAPGAGSGDVTAASNITDGALVVGDGGAKGIKGHASGAPGTAAFAATGDFATAAQGTAADAALPKAGGEMSGNITMAGAQTVDGRDVSADGTKLDAIEALADVTDAANVGAVNAAATSKVTPVDADSFPIVDSEAASVIKRTTFTNFKAFLKTYFDTLYQPLVAALTSWAAITRAAGFDTFAATPSSANLAALVTGETGSGALVFGTSPTFAGIVTIAGQIAFPATANPSADANTLDEYEEGTFTPGLSFDDGTTGITYATQTGVYTRIGRLVMYAINLVLSNNGSSTGNALITGLPFNVAIVATPTSFIGWANTASLSNPVGLVSSSTVIPYNQGATGITQLTDANFPDTANIYLSGTYVA